MEQRLGKYEIRGILGKGAMGTVYDARDPVIDRRVAWWPTNRLMHCASRRVKRIWKMPLSP